MTHQIDIKRLADGSIDYAHYITVSDVIRRSDRQQARKIIIQAFKKIWVAIKSHLLEHFVANYLKASQNSR